ncbi:unnamed protein product, partial [Owenia fusiformis]
KKKQEFLKMIFYTAGILAFFAICTYGSPIQKRQATEWTWVDLPGGCIKNFNNKIIKSVESLDACKRLCEVETSVVCLSIDYNKGKSQCQLSVKYSGNNPLSYPCHAGTEWSYAERQMQGSCPIGQVQFNTACYLIDTEKKTHEAASSSCQTQGGQLTSILSAIENAFLAVELERTHTESKHTYFYIGLSGKNNEYTQWADGNSVGYTNWGKGEPENNKEECVTIEKQEGFKWHDVTCGRSEASICKFEQKIELNENWVDTPGACIKNFNNRIIKPVNTMDACKKRCEDETAFRCWSIDYNAGASQCQLSERYSGNNPISDPCHAGPQWSYAEIFIEGTIDITADDAYDLFVDGAQVGSGRSWKQAQRYSISYPENVQVIAVKGWDTGKVVSGIILSFRHSDVLLNTDSRWKCFFGSVDPLWNQPGYDDSAWPAAVEFSTNRDDSYVKTNNGKPWWPQVDKAAKMIWTKNSYRDTTVYCRYTLKASTTPRTTPETTTPKLTTTPTTTIPVPICQYIGQLLADKVDPCRFYQCAYADNNLNLRAVSMPCAPGTSVPPSYVAGNPCIGPALDQCPKGKGI